MHGLLSTAHICHERALLSRTAPRIIDIIVASKRLHYFESHWLILTPSVVTRTDTLIRSPGVLHTFLQSWMRSCYSVVIIWNQLWMIHVIRILTGLMWLLSIHPFTSIGYNSRVGYHSRLNRYIYCVSRSIIHLRSQKCHFNCKK